MRVEDVLNPDPHGRLGPVAALGLFGQRLAALALAVDVAFQLAVAKLCLRFLGSIGFMQSIAFVLVSLAAMRFSVSFFMIAAYRLKVRQASAFTTAVGSIIRLHIHSRAVVGDGCRRCSVIHVRPWRQELRIGWQVSAYLLLEHSARHFIDHAHLDRIAIWRCRDQQGQHPAGGNGKTRAHVGQRWRAGAVACDQLLAGVGAALEADADAVDDRRCEHRHLRRTISDTRIAHALTCNMLPISGKDVPVNLGLSFVRAILPRAL